MVRGDLPEAGIGSFLLLTPWHSFIMSTAPIHPLAPAIESRLGDAFEKQVFRRSPAIAGSDHKSSSTEPFRHATQINLSVTGSVECQLQYGSSSDVRNGDGIVMDDSYPLECG